MWVFLLPGSFCGCYIAWRPYIISYGSFVQLSPSLLEKCPRWESNPAHHMAQHPFGEPGLTVSRPPGKLVLERRPNARFLFRRVFACVLRVFRVCCLCLRVFRVCCVCSFFCTCFLRIACPFTRTPMDFDALISVSRFFL